MTIASMLAVIDGGSGSRAALEAAFAVARRFDAYLEVLHVEPDPNESVPLVGEGMSGAMVEQVMVDLRAQATRNAHEARAQFEAQCEAHDLPALSADGAAEPGKFIAAWRQVVGHEDDEVARRGLLFDLIAVARPGDGAEGAYAPALEASLFRSGRPVLVAAPAFHGQPGKQVVVAWNETREAARALSAALPFLVRAEGVTLLALGEDGREPPALDGVAGYLALHGIEARRHTAAAHGATGAALLEEAAALQGDLLVMGAYGHSRLREFILGGATRSVLSQAPIPVFMAH